MFAAAQCETVRLHIIRTDVVTPMMWWQGGRSPHFLRAWFVSMCLTHEKRFRVPVATTNADSSGHTFTRYIRLLCFLHGRVSHSCNLLLYIKYRNSKTQLKEFSRQDMRIHRKHSLLTNGTGMPWKKIHKSYTLFFFRHQEFHHSIIFFCYFYPISLWDGEMVGNDSQAVVSFIQQCIRAKLRGRNMRSQ